MLEQRHVDETVALGDADALAERANRLGGEASPAQPGEGGHPRVVPAGDVTPFDQLLQLALGEHRVREVQPGELDLARPRLGQDLIEKPVVKGAVIFEFESADRVRYLFDRVRVAVGKVVHRVDAPRVAGTVVMLSLDPVHDRIAEVLVGRLHVDLRAEDMGAVGEFAVPHPAEEVQVLRDRALAVGADAAGGVEASAAFANLFDCLAVDVRVARFDEDDGEVVELREVIGGEELPVRPVEAQPAYVFLDRANELVFLRARVGVVEAQIAGRTRGSARNPEVEADALGVTDMEISIRFGRKAGHDAAAIPPGFDVALHRFENEVRQLLRLARGHGGACRRGATFLYRHGKVTRLM